jgi:NAD(P)-dependent dehydrogenase (short-subunit alcohol dehydrogenase family)
MPKAIAGENPVPPLSELTGGALLDLTGKACCVTGGGSGIGAMIAAGFVANGATCFIVSRKVRSREREGSEGFLGARNSCSRLYMAGDTAGDTAGGERKGKRGLRF